MSKKLSYRLSKSVTENFERLLKSGGYKEDALNKFDLYVTPYFNDKKKPVFEGDNNTVLFVALNNPYGVEINQGDVPFDTSIYPFPESVIGDGGNLEVLTEPETEKRYVYTYKRVKSESGVEYQRVKFYPADHTHKFSIYKHQYRRVSLVNHVAEAESKDYVINVSEVENNNVLSFNVNPVATLNTLFSKDSDRLKQYYLEDFAAAGPFKYGNNTIRLTPKNDNELIVRPQDITVKVIGDLAKIPKTDLKVYHFWFLRNRTYRKVGNNDIDFRPIIGNRVRVTPTGNNVMEIILSFTYTGDVRGQGEFIKRANLDTSEVTQVPDLFELPVFYKDGVVKPNRTRLAYAKPMPGKVITIKTKEEVDYFINKGTVWLATADLAEFPNEYKEDYLDLQGDRYGQNPWNTAMAGRIAGVDFTTFSKDVYNNQNITVYEVPEENTRGFNISHSSIDTIEKAKKAAEDIYTMFRSYFIDGYTAVAKSDEHTSENEYVLVVTPKPGLEDYVVNKFYIRAQVTTAAVSPEA